MTLEQDWERLKIAYLRARANSANPHLYIYAHILELRKTGGKGIDFVIRRLWADDKYSRRIHLYGGPLPPRYPLRVTGRRVFFPPDFESKYIYLELPEFEASGVRRG